MTYNRETSSFKKYALTLMSVFFVISAASHADLNAPVEAGVSSEQKPPELEGVGIDEKLGEQIDPTITLTDHNGQKVQLSQFFNKDHRPLILSLVYYSCPGLCNFHLNAMVDVMKPMDWGIGQQFKYLTVSFDTSETTETALKKRESYLQQYGRMDAEKEWWFFTGDAENIKKLTANTGFRYKWIEKNKEWSHGSAAIILTPEGKISRYLPGLTLDQKSLKLALNEAADGRIGNLMDRLIMYCFHYDPSHSKYTFYAANIMKAGGAVIVLLLGLYLVLAWRRENRKAKQMVRS